MPIDESEDAMNQLDARSEGATVAHTQAAASASDSRRPPGQLAVSLLSSVVAGTVSLALLLTASSEFLCAMIARPRGANIATGATIGLLGCIAGFVAAIAVRNRARLLSAVLLGQAATLSVAIGFIARDSATATVTQDCGFFESDVSTSTHHVEYAYVLLGLAIIALVAQALRGVGRSPRHVGGAVAGILSVALLVAVFPAYGGSSNKQSTASSPPRSVLVCRALFAPEALGGPQCDPEGDVGRAPIKPPEGLMCSTELRGVRGKKIGIQVFYEGSLIRHANLRSSDRETSPYVYFDSSWVDWIATGTRLPIGHYRCRFLVNSNIVRTRTIAVGRLPFARTPLRYHYKLELRKAGKPLPAGPAHLGQEFTIWVSSKDLPVNTAVRFSLCVNHAHGEACDNGGYYLAGRKPTAVYWEVDRGEGSGNRYRLSVRVRGREVARRDLRLLRAAPSSRSKS